MKEYTAYQGDKYTIEWYFTEKGESQSLEFFKAARNDYIERVREGKYYEE